LEEEKQEEESQLEFSPIFLTFNSERQNLLEKVKPSSSSSTIAFVEKEPIDLLSMPKEAW
jgi:hypothetical protein